MAELVYPGKASTGQIIGETVYVSLKRIRVVGDISGSGWYNRIFLGDNLPILKSLLKWKERGEFVNRDRSPGIRLIYIDPPFGTGDSYARNAVQAYSGKTTGDRYLEWLRRRIILLRELLSDDGSFYMRTDYHFGHYMKVLCDEVFGADKFRNEIIINRTKKVFDGISRFNTATDSLLFYTKGDRYFFNGVDKPRGQQKWIPMHSPGIRWSRVDPEYLPFYRQEDLKMRRKGAYSRGRVFQGKVLSPPEGRHWTFSQERLERYRKEGRIRLNPKNGVPEYLTSDREIVASDWTDIPGYSFKWNYPTENSEQLLERIIGASSEPGDILLDAFAGSGTTGAVGEKMGRRWIMLDSSRTSGFTMLKRMLSLRKHIGNRGRSLSPSPFATYEALYGKEILSDRSFQKYVAVVLEIFGCEEKVEIFNRVRIDGRRGNDPVMVFNWKKEGEGVLHPDHIRQLHRRLGESSWARFFIIVPSSLIAFHEDSLLLDDTEYHILRVPNSILLELSRGDARKIQSDGQMDVIYLMNDVALDLVFPPSVKCRYSTEDGSSGPEVVVRILDFKSHVYSKRPLEERERGIDALEMVAVDNDYNREYFRLSRIWHAKELAEVEYELRFPVPDVKGEMMMVFWDRYGNEKKEVWSVEDFKRFPNHSSSHAGHRKSR